MSLMEIVERRMQNTGETRVIAFQAVVALRAAVERDVEEALADQSWIRDWVDPDAR